MLHLNNRIISGDPNLFTLHASFLRMVALLVGFVLCSCAAGNQEGSLSPEVPLKGGQQTLGVIGEVEETSAPISQSISSTVDVLIPTDITAGITESFEEVTDQAPPTATISPTNDPYEKYTIGYLTTRGFEGQGDIHIERKLDENSYFTRLMFSYPSDGLRIYGFINVPKLERIKTDKMPVIIALHGYIDPEIYDTIDYTTRYADALARAGFLVLHPNLRNYPPSDSGDNLFRVGMAIDVLNLISIIKEQAGESGPLELGDPDSIGLWGHSMGGGIAIRVMTISPDVDSVVLYGSMSGDDHKNYERIYSYFSNGEQGVDEISTPEDIFDKISPINFLDQVTAAVSIHHGKLDPDVPEVWSKELCQKLRSMDHQVECFTYDDQYHTFSGEGDRLLMQRMIEFYTRTLRGD